MLLSPTDPYLLNTQCIFELNIILAKIVLNDEVIILNHVKHCYMLPTQKVVTENNYPFYIYANIKSLSSLSEDIVLNNFHIS